MTPVLHRERPLSQGAATAYSIS